MNMLKNFFISEVRVKILKLLLLNPDENYHVRAVVRAVDAEINAVRRELENLISIGFLTRRQSSNRLYYAVNTEHPLYPEMLSLVAKEEGIGKAIIENADSIGHVEFAMVSKGFVKGREATLLDVDLFVVGNISLDALTRIVKEQELKYGTEINFSTMTFDEFQYRKRTLDSFIMKILAQSRIMLVGDEERFCSLS
ncbi:hypothetical protein JXA34_00495 [Patescibacteria group bacterium]|nr:hypothetical protein [Patescibacteria group bacterium]